MPNRRRRYWVVPVSRGWVQLRRGSSPPRWRPSQVTKTVLGERPEWDLSVGIYVSKPFKRRLVLSCGYYSGGTYVGTVKASRVANLLKVSVRMGGSLEVTPTQVKALLGGKEHQDE